MQYIYLHGFLSDSNSIKGTYLRKQFAQMGLTLLTPDLNVGDFQDLTLTRELGVIDKLIASSDEETTLLGSSLGGYLAVLYAQSHPLVTRLVLIAPAFRFATRILEQMEPFIVKQWEKLGVLEIADEMGENPRLLHYSIVKDALSYDAIPLNREIPTFIFHGLYDDIISYSASIEYLESNPLAQLLILPSDHTLIDNLETIWRHTRAFLEL